MNGLPTTIPPLTVGPVQVGYVVTIADLQIAALVALAVLLGLWLCVWGRK